MFVWILWQCSVHSLFLYGDGLTKLAMDEQQKITSYFQTMRAPFRTCFLCKSSACVFSLFQNLISCRIEFVLHEYCLFLMENLAQFNLLAFIFFARLLAQQRCWSREVLSLHLFRCRYNDSEQEKNKTFFILNRTTGKPKERRRKVRSN